MSVIILQRFTNWKMGGSYMNRINKIQKILISLKMQSLEQRRRFTTLLIVFILPVAFWASIYYTASEEPTPITVPTLNGNIEVFVPVKKSYPIDLGLMAVSWTMAVVAFFAESGSAEKDRRLVLCGYGSWQILFARFILLAGMTLFTSTIPLILFVPILSPKHSWILWLALFIVGLIAMEIGLLIGALIPRYTEGVLIIIALFGIGMSIQGEAAKFFLTYPARQLFRSGLFAENPLVFPFAGQELLIFIILIVVTIVFWYFRIRVYRDEF
jgi:hypothetical protein